MTGSGQRNPTASNKWSGFLKTSSGLLFMVIYKGDN
jgi:hypothetical protein